MENKVERQHEQELKLERTLEREQHYNLRERETERVKKNTIGPKQAKDPLKRTRSFTEQRKSYKEDHSQYTAKYREARPGQAVVGWRDARTNDYLRPSTRKGVWLGIKRQR